jgi:hypothetical protein
VAASHAPTREGLVGAGQPEEPAYAPTPADILRMACHPNLTQTMADVSEGW